MKILRACGFAIFAGIALSLGTVAQAGAIYDNLSAVSTGSDPVFTSTPNNLGLGPIADSFSTGAAATLVDVKFLLSGDPTSPSSTSVDLLSNVPTVPLPTPGSLVAHLGSILDSQLSTSAGVIDISGLNVMLSANTRYWIELSSPDTTAMWYWSTDISGPGVAGEFFFNAGGPFTNDNGPYQMQVNVAGAAGVPEPSTLTLGLFGIGSLFVLRRRMVR